MISTTFGHPLCNLSLLALLCSSVVKTTVKQLLSQASSTKTHQRSYSILSSKFLMLFISDSFFLERKCLFMDFSGCSEQQTRSRPINCYGFALTSSRLDPILLCFCLHQKTLRKTAGRLHSSKWISSRASQKIAYTRWSHQN